MRGREGAGAWALLSLSAVAWQNRREGGGVRAFMFPGSQRTHSLLAPLSFPPSLPLKTRIPLSAKSKLEGP